VRLDAMSRKGTQMPAQPGDRAGGAGSEKHNSGHPRTIRPCASVTRGE
jgi:hypothetical protein